MRDRWKAAILALVIGFVLTGGKGYGQNPNSAPANTPASNPAPTPSPTLAVKPEPPAYRYSCQRPENGEQENLCIERRAALASEEQALWAERTFWIGLAGTLAVIATFGINAVATLAASRSAKAAEAAADAALRALPRPWVLVEILQHSMQSWASGHGPLTVSFRIKNYGSGPAFIDYISVSGYFLTVGEPGDNVRVTIEADGLPTEEQVDLHMFPHEKQILQLYWMGTGRSAVSMARYVNGPVNLEEGEERADLYVVIEDKIGNASGVSPDPKYLSSCLAYRPCLVVVIDYKDVYGRDFHTRAAAQGGSEGDMSTVGGTALNRRT